MAGRVYRCALPQRKEPIKDRRKRCRGSGGLRLIFQETQHVSFHSEQGVLVSRLAECLFQHRIERVVRAATSSDDGRLLTAWPSYHQIETTHAIALAAEGPETHAAARGVPVGLGGKRTRLGLLASSTKKVQFMIDREYAKMAAVYRIPADLP
eukprot:COSAG01_NODE_2107_length_8406_cov_21.249158_7_plen_153_part_00